MLGGAKELNQFGFVAGRRSARISIQTAYGDWKRLIAHKCVVSTAECAIYIVHRPTLTTPLIPIIYFVLEIYRNHIENHGVRRACDVNARGKGQYVYTRIVLLLSSFSAIRATTRPRARFLYTRYGRFASEKAIQEESRPKIVSRICRAREDADVCACEACNSTGNAMLMVSRLP